MAILYTAHATATGGRDGSAKTDDGKIDVKLSVPKEIGGPGGDGTNPEQLFAAGYSACFLGALKAVAGQKKLRIGPDATIKADVSFNKDDSGFSISAVLTASLPGLDKAEAQELLEAAHQVCPYSKATRGNIPVELKLA